MFVFIRCGRPSDTDERDDDGEEIPHDDDDDFLDSDDDGLADAAAADDDKGDEVKGERGKFRGGEEGAADVSTNRCPCPS